jgi:competence protein ComEA
MVKIFLIQNIKKILLGICLVLGLVIIYYNSFSKSSNEIGSDNNNACSCANEVKTYYIEVMGQVVNPGVYEIDEKKLVIEAIELAGGYTANADLTFVHRSISLSSVVKPTQKIYIPAKDENYIPTFSNLSGTSVISNGKININSADRTTLMTISGVGEVTADKIIELRPLTSMDDLNNLSNVPKKTIDNILAKAEL